MTYHVFKKTKNFVVHFLIVYQCLFLVSDGHTNNSRAPFLDLTGWSGVLGESSSFMDSDLSWYDYLELMSGFMFSGNWSQPSGDYVLSSFPLSNHS